MALQEIRSWWTWIALGSVLALTAALAALAIAPAPAAAQDSVSVSAVDNAFEPVSVEIGAGGTVTWTNNGELPHTVTGDNFAVNATLNPGESVSHTFSEPGTYSYVCTFHPGMAGTVVVAGDPAAPAPPPAAEDPPTLPTTGVGTAASVQAGGTLVVLAGLLMVIGLGALRPRHR